MDLEIVIVSEVSQTEKDKYHMISLTFGIKKKKDTSELIYNTEIDRNGNRPTDIENKLMVTTGERWEGGIN